MARGNMETSTLTLEPQTVKDQRKLRRSWKSYKSKLKKSLLQRAKLEGRDEVWVQGEIEKAATDYLITDARRKRGAKVGEPAAHDSAEHKCKCCLLRRSGGGADSHGSWAEASMLQECGCPDGLFRDELGLRLW